MRAWTRIWLHAACAVHEIDIKRRDVLFCDVRQRCLSRRLCGVGYVRVAFFDDGY